MFLLHRLGYGGSSPSVPRVGTSLSTSALLPSSVNNVQHHMQHHQQQSNNRNRSDTEGSSSTKVCVRVLSVVQLCANPSEYGQSRNTTTCSNGQSVSHWYTFFLKINAKVQWRIVMVGDLIYRIQLLYLSVAIQLGYDLYFLNRARWWPIWSSHYVSFLSIE